MFCLRNQDITDAKAFFIYFLCRTQVSSHFSWIYAYFYNKYKTEFTFRAYEKNNSYEFTIMALSEVKALLCSGLHHSIHGEPYRVCRRLFI